MERSTRLEHMYKTLKDHADQVHAPVLALAKQEAAAAQVKLTSMYIDGKVYVSKASRALLDKIAALLSVTAIELQSTVHIVPNVVPSGPDDTHNPNVWATPWIEVPAVWASGNTGKGVVVASIDSGPRSSVVQLAARVCLV
ncbi:hypothetical protein AC1031_001667 [Aphanomyces cochlioides]|nr:hypothetical protein AC1031_001667 [Aphanomyces cochlioides]